MHPDTRRYLIATALIVVAAILTQAARALRGGETVYHPDFSAVPLQIAEYRGEKLPDDESMLNYLGAQAMEERVYRGPDRSINLTLIYGTDWRSIHAPTGCYPAQGWTIVHDKAEEMAAPKDCPHPGPLNVRLLDATKDKDRELALFCYARPGATTSDWTAHGFRVATGPRGAGGMIVTLRTRVRPGEDPRAAEGEMKKLFTVIYPKAVGFWYTQATASGKQ